MVQSKPFRGDREDKPILDCKVGDIIQFVPQFSDRVLVALIVGESYFVGHERWEILPLSESRKAYSIKKIALPWKKLVQTGYIINIRNKHFNKESQL
jgi:hypothetical protein